MTATQTSQNFPITEIAVANILYVAAEYLPERRSMFSANGYRVLWANTLTIANRLWRENNFDFVLLDAKLLEKDLFAAEQFRVQINRASCPLIVFAARSNNQAREIAFQSGASDFIHFDLPEEDILWRLRFQKQAAAQLSEMQTSYRQASFLAELGRRLLVALEPDQILNLLAAAVYEATDGVLCAAAADVTGKALTIAAFSREGEAEGADEIVIDKVKEWLGDESRLQSTHLTNPVEFLLCDEFHQSEYVAPMIVGERVKGLIVVGFDNERECTPEIKLMIDAAANFAAPSVHVTSLYDAALNASIYIVKEEQKRFTEAILDTLPISLYAIDRDYRIVAWNRHREIGKQGIPREAALGRNVFDVLPRQPRSILQREFERAFETGQIERVEQKTADERGAIKHWLISKIPMRDSATGEVTHVISVGEDITARVEANHAVARAEKLAAVGRLAAGVVHEINNPLATIAACAESLENRANENAFGKGEDVDDLRDYLNLIRSEAFRCKSITNGLLDFSRVRTGHRTPLNVAEVVQAAAKLVAHQKRGENIEIRVESAEKLPAANIDEGQIQQAVIALATNAIDAMPDGGQLTFRVFARRQRVFVEIEDTGVGILPANMTKIFEPFFTTKEVGSGTGLGLAVCYGIVTDHGGNLTVRSTVNVGSTFTLSLPINVKNDKD